jgi:hypothetical protein
MVDDLPFLARVLLTGGLSLMLFVVVVIKALIFVELLEAFLLKSLQRLKQQFSMTD